jgi:hypothetical protein
VLTGACALLLLAGLRLEQRAGPTQDPDPRAAANIRI